jgi:hypothetical protein
MTPRTPLRSSNQRPILSRPNDSGSPRGTGSPGGIRQRRQASHPDDVLRQLAKSPGSVVTPQLEFQRRRRPPLNPYSLGLQIGLGVIGLLLVAPWVLPGRHSVKVAGLVPGDAVRPETLASNVVEITVDPPSGASSAVVKLDGVVVEPKREQGKLSLVLGSSVEEGAHTLSVQSGPRRLYRPPAKQNVSFIVDGVAPEVTARISGSPKSLEEGFTVTGKAEPGSSVLLNGKPVTLLPDGAYSFAMKRAPIGAIRLSATDKAGNVGTTMLPGMADRLYPATRGVHVSAAAWGNAGLRKKIVSLISEGRINTVQLDLKDEDGRIGHVSAVPLVNQLQASDNTYDLRTEVAYLKSLGVRVVGRLVVFRDPVLATKAWAGGHQEQVLQTSDGQPYAGKYGGFTNPFDKTVRNYNTAIALEAAEAGVDDILLDYIRRPEAAITKLKFTGVEGEVDSKRVNDEIVAYIAELGLVLNETPARLGASVFGIAFYEGDNIGQDVPEMSKHLDYVAPMIYPSSWTKGQLGVANPPYQPYDIVKASLLEFQRVSKGTGTRIIPWLQDFNLVKKYDAKDVRAQIIAAADVCVPDWLMWDPKVTYNVDGLPVGVQAPKTQPDCATQSP